MTRGKWAFIVHTVMPARRKSSASSWFDTRFCSVFTLASLGTFLLATGIEGTAPVVRFPVQTLANGVVIPAHASASSEPSDVDAARRRLELLRSPYLQIGERRSVRGGEILIGFDSSIGADRRDHFSKALSSAASFLFEREGWAKPFSLHAPLQVLVGRAHTEAISVAAWEGRTAGAFVHPVLCVSDREDGGESDAIHQLAFLSLRFTASEESGWAVEALAEWLARRVTGTAGESSIESDPFLEESGALTTPNTLVPFFELLASRLPRGAADIRLGWEEAGGVRGDDAESFLRSLADRADPRGLAGLLADTIVRHLSAPGADGWISTSFPSRRFVFSGEVTAGAPGPFGWRRLALRTSEERGGLEITLPEGTVCSAGRAVIFYRGENGGFDSVGLLPGERKALPLAGTTRLNLVLVDGSEPGELFIHLRRLPDYPASLAGFGAEWKDGAVQLTWRTSSHRDLLAWVVVRFEETRDGLIELGREIVPTTDSSDGGFHYHVADREAQVAHRYVYRVAALTRDGVLSESFETSLVPGL